MADDNRTTRPMTHPRLGATMLGAWGLYQVVAGAYFIFLRPSLLAEDLRAAATTLEAVHAAAPRLEVGLNWVSAVLGGQMAALGVLLWAQRSASFGGIASAQGRSSHTLLRAYCRLG